MTAKEYLRRPYARRLTPDEGGGFTATIQEFPGCIADGTNAEEALTNLETAAESWIEAALALGQEIPDPIALHGYSGKIALRIPRGLHKQAAEMSASEGTSVNQFLLAAIANYLGGKQAFGKAAQEFVRLNWAQTVNIHMWTKNLSIERGDLIEAKTESNVLSSGLMRQIKALPLVGDRTTRASHG